MALLDLASDRVSRRTQEAANITKGRSGTPRKAAFELVPTFLVLIGIAVGTLSLRFALVLMHGVLH
jgi:hypothetical protein